MKLSIDDVDYDIKDTEIAYVWSSQFSKARYEDFFHWDLSNHTKDDDHEVYWNELQQICLDLDIRCSNILSHEMLNSLHERFINRNIKNSLDLHNKYERMNLLIHFLEDKMSGKNPILYYNLNYSYNRFITKRNLLVDKPRELDLIKGNIYLHQSEVFKSFIELMNSNDMYAPNSTYGHTTVFNGSCLIPLQDILFDENLAISYFNKRKTIIKDKSFEEIKKNSGYHLVATPVISNKEINLQKPSKISIIA